MVKAKDIVFWIATANFILALALFALTQDQLWLYLLVGSYLLRPTLASFGVKQARVDERQMIIHYRSGNIAYGITNTVALLFAAMNLIEGKSCYLSFIMVVAIGVVVRVLFVIIVSRRFHNTILQNLQFSIRAALTYFRKHLDEWQLQVHYRSGNIAFATDIVMAIAYTIYYAAHNDHTFEMFIGVVMTGLASKALFNVLLVKDYRMAASKMIMGVGLLVALFSSFEAGFNWETLLIISPGLAIAGLGWLAKKYPRVVGSIVLVVTVALLVIIIGKGFRWGQIETALLICGPMVVAAICLFIPDRPSKEIETVESVT